MLTSLIIGVAKSKVLLGSAVITGVIGATKGIKGARDLKRASKAYNKLVKSIEESQNELNVKKDVILKNIEKLDKIKMKTYENEIKDILKIYAKIENISVKEKDLYKIKDIPLESIKISIKDTKNLTLKEKDNKKTRIIGTSSLGVAIGSLLSSEEENNNIETEALRGLVAGPALLIAGKAFETQGREKLKSIIGKYEESQVIIKELHITKKEYIIIQEELEALIFKIEELLIDFNKLFDKMKEIVDKKTDWKQYEKKEKELIELTLDYFQVIYNFVKVPLLTKDARVREEVKKLIDNSGLNNKLDEMIKSLEIDTSEDNSKKSNNKINVNIATKDELMKLPNIGGTKANDIIKYRKKSQIKEFNDMLNIKGIGEKTLEELKSVIEIK